jgi:uncharacterized membrane protein
MNAPAHTRPRDPHHARAWAWGLTAAAILITGIVLVTRGDQIDQTGNGSAGAAWVGWGIFLVLTPIVSGIFAAVVWLISRLSNEHAQYKAWKQTLTPDQQLGLYAAETAALYATWAGVHHWVQEGKERSAAQYHERTATAQERAQRFLPGGQDS